MKYNGKIGSYLINHSNSNQEILQQSDRVTYHYTSPNAFLSIIKNRKIRFSDIRYMNDRSEEIYLVKVLLEFFEKNKGKYPLCKEALNRILKLHSIEKLIKLEVLNIEFYMQQKYKSPRKFVFCTCLDADSINMWNYYINNDKYQGYSIGFNTYNFLKTFDNLKKESSLPFGVLCGRVLYSREEQNAEVDIMLSNLENQNTLNTPYDLDVYLRVFIDRYGAFFKHPKFSVENEYRFVLEIDDEYFTEEKKELLWSQNQRIKYDFTIKNGLVVPFLELLFNEDSITRIYTAPTTEYEIAKDGVRKLLKKYKYRNVQTYQSDIPIRF